ncbi:hypothetical protein ACMFMG_005526 [Clarireedia jacksonii]
MKDIGVEYQSALPNPVATAQNAWLPGGKHRNLDWKAQKETIRSLYMDEDKTLKDTMDIMKNAHYFDATHKQYKNKFKEWGWQKNLPSETARFMTEKAKRRRQTENKETVFSFGGKVWKNDHIERRAARAKKKASLEDDLEEVSTPHGVSYKTPKATFDTPHLEHSESDSSSDNSSDNVVQISDDGDDTDFENMSGSGDSPGNDKIALTWQGHSISDLQALWHIACNHRDAGEVNEAEGVLRKVLLGMGHVSGKTNGETVKVAHNLADLYATTDRIGEAMTVLEELIEAHVYTWGCEDKRMQDNVLQAVGFLNTWNRSDDAMALLSLSREVLATCTSRTTPKNRRRAGDKGKGIRRSTTKIHASHLSEVTDSVLLKNATPASIDSALRVVQARFAAKDRTAISLLVAMISQCEGRLDLSIQQIKAYAELLMLYQKLDKVEENSFTFQKAFATLDAAWEAHNWYHDEIESFDFMEAALQLVANALKCGYRPEARRMFLVASVKASEVFGSDDERTVWVHITIGLVYQTHMTWNDAEEWFEQALTAAYRNREWGPKDGITRSLQTALDRHHFSYVSDKGRPFKTVFGVSGLKIIPGRLHLE